MHRVGLHISYFVMKYVTNMCDGSEFITSDYEKIKSVKKFRYLGEMIQQNSLEQEVTPRIPAD